MKGILFWIQLRSLIYDFDFDFVARAHVISHMCTNIAVFACITISCHLPPHACFCHVLMLLKLYSQVTGEEYKFSKSNH